MSVTDLSAAQRSALEIQIRGTPWKVLVKRLKGIVEQKHEALELPPMIRRWLEINRGTPRDEVEAAHIAQEVRALQWRIDAQGDSGRWFEDKTETAPISGWVISASHLLKDGKRSWLFAARRHDDRAPLVGPTVPAPATPADLKKLGKIIAYAGGDPKRELLRTGAISQKEHDDFIAAGKSDIAEYGQIFYWWRA